MNILTTGRTFTPPTMAPLANDLSLVDDTTLPDVAAEGDLAITGQYPEQATDQFSFSHGPATFDGRSLRSDLLEFAAEHSFAIKAVMIGTVMAAGLAGDAIQTPGFEFTPALAGLGDLFRGLFGGDKTATTEPPDWKIRKTSRLIGEKLNGRSKSIYQDIGPGEETARNDLIKRLLTTGASEDEVASALANVFHMSGKNRATVFGATSQVLATEGMNTDDVSMVQFITETADSMSGNTPVAFNAVPGLVLGGLTLPDIATLFERAGKYRGADSFDTAVAKAAKALGGKFIEACKIFIEQFEREEAKQAALLESTKADAAAAGDRSPSHESAPTVTYSYYDPAEKSTEDQHGTGLVVDLKALEKQTNDIVFAVEPLLKGWSDLLARSGSSIAEPMRTDLQKAFDLLLERVKSPDMNYWSLMRNSNFTTEDSRQRILHIMAQLLHRPFGSALLRGKDVQRYERPMIAFTGVPLPVALYERLDSVIVFPYDVKKTLHIIGHSLIHEIIHAIQTRDEVRQFLETTEQSWNYRALVDYIQSTEGGDKTPYEYPTLAAQFELINLLSGNYLRDKVERGDLLDEDDVFAHVYGYSKDDPIISEPGRRAHARSTWLSMMDPYFKGDRDGFIKAINGEYNAKPF